MSVLGTCVACEIPNVRVATATAECACLVCEKCANQFMTEGVCGVCGMAFDDDTFDESDPD